MIELLILQQTSLCFSINLMKFFSNPKQTFTYTCCECGHRFKSDKPPQKVSIFCKSNSKIVNHQVNTQELNLKCPSCGSHELNLDWGKAYDSSCENQENHLDSQIPVTTKQKVCVFMIEKIIGALSFFAGKITKVDKVKKDSIE